MDSFSGKRQRDSEPRERNFRQRKRNSQFGGDQEQVLPTPDDTTYRILCPASKIGSVIGKGGNIIKTLRRETHARIKVTDPVPGVDERVILIWSTPQEEERSKEQDGDDVDTKFRDGREKGGNKKAGDYTMPEDGSFLCPAQEALFKVHARIVEEEGNPSDNEDEEDDEEAPRQNSEVTARLLVPNNQIGCLLGKGGKIIEKMRNDTGAQIRILRKDTLPGCALPSDELVQISGDPLLVKKAMYEISARIHESPPRDRPQGTANFLPPPMLPPGGPMLSQANVFPPMNSMYGPANAGGPLMGVGPPPLSGFGGMDPGAPWPLTNSALPMYPPPTLPHPDGNDRAGEQEFFIHLLCPNDKIGIVIGKGGNAIRLLRDATGARIKVEEVVPEAEERLIVISAYEYLDDRSPVIEAVLQLQGKTCDIGGDKEGLITTRLLVPNRQIGCLLGKGGSVISEMRKKTNANLKVLQKKDLPKCAQETDELVQIIGEENVARQALLEVLTRLRNNVFREQIDARVKSGGLSMPSFGGPAMQGGFPSASLNIGSRHELESPGGMYSLNGLGLQGGQLPSNYSALAPLQGAGSGYGGYSGFESSLYSGRLSGGGVGLSDGSVRNPSSKVVEVTIPGSSVNSVLGKGGSNISSIREISGAKLKVHEPHPHSGERVVEIYGTPEQTQAAHSLLQAFIYSGQSSAGAGPRGLY